jgi:hypothetical protein
MTFGQRMFLALAILIFDFVVFFLPVAAILGAYVLMFRPPWFAEWVARVYRNLS